MFTDEFFFGGLFGIWIALVLGFLAVVALAIVAIATGRSEPDPEGRRAYGFYLAAVGLVTILVALFAATDAAGSLIASVVEKDEEFDAGYSYPDEFSEGEYLEFEGGIPSDEYFPEPPGEFDPDDDRYVNAVRSGLVAAAAIAIYWLHRRRLDAVHDESQGRTGPAWQMHYGYLLALAFLGLIVWLGAVSDALFGVFRALAPGITGYGGEDAVEQRAGLSELIRSGILAAAAGFVFQWHWRRSQAVATPEPPRPQPELPPLPLEETGETPEPGVV